MKNATWFGESSMKRKHARVFGFALALAVGVGVAGCTDDLTSVNDNPNSPTEVPVRFYMPEVIQEGADIFLGTAVQLDIASMWIQHMARLQYGYTGRYEFEADFSDGLWLRLYAGPIADIQAIISRSQAGGNANAEAVGRILRAWFFQHMTELWGDIPYSQAGLGEDGPIAPPYDSQSEIYDGIIEDLATAQSLIVPGSSVFSDAKFDILYGGSAEGWRRFANSLRLRVGMRLSEVDPGKAQSVVAAAVQAGVFRSADEEARLNYTGSPPNENPMAVEFRNRPMDQRMSNTMIDTLQSLNDPRLPVFAQPARQSGEYLGLQNGLPDFHGIAFESVSRLGTFFQDPNLPGWFMTYEEVLFLQAEAAQRGWIAGNAAELYHDAIEANLQRFGVSQADIDAYLANPDVQYDPAEWQKKVGLQKWISLFDNSTEAYAEYRRTGWPLIQPGPGNVNNDQVPLRIPYPSTEQDLNPQSLSEAIARQGGPSVNIPLWWDVH